MPRFSLIHASCEITTRRTPPSELSPVLAIGSG
jgi:hypothetical protein